VCWREEERAGLPRLELCRRIVLTVFFLFLLKEDVKSSSILLENMVFCG